MMWEGREGGRGRKELTGNDVSYFRSPEGGNALLSDEVVILYLSYALRRVRL